MDAVEEIKSRLSIDDVVSQYLELKRSGRNFKGLSPFSQEKTPSLMVSPEKQIWHDFSSGKGGDMFSFVMELEGIDFKAALDLLARQAGVDLSQYRTQASGEASKHKDQLYNALELAAKFYQVHLSRNKTVLDYVVTQRKFSKSTATTFRLGYSPNQDAALVSFLRGKGFSEAIIKSAGLGTKRYRGFGDMFRGRLMVPLQDSTGRVIGFTARLLDKNPDAPKYINTPQSPVYDKSRHVFGLHLAKDDIRKQDFAIVVEGNLDVIASHQAGVINVVATAGTALTEAHLKALSRFTNDIRLAFDQDEAGLKATERAIPIASKVGVNLSIVSVPEGKDPDELIKKDAKIWQEIVAKPQYAVDWIMDRYGQKLDLTTAQGKRKFSDRVLSVIDDLSDSVEKDHYLHKMAKILGVSVDALRTKSSGKAKVTKKPEFKHVKDMPVVSNATADQLKAENKLLALCLLLPSLRTYLDPLTPEMFLQPKAKELLNFIKGQPEFNYEEETASGQLQELSEYGKMLALLFEELYQNLEVIELRYEATRLQIRQIETYVKTKKSQLAIAMQTANESEIDQMLESAKKLDVLLKSAKEKSR
ncbi:MAG: primase [Patescibacteria group bacterium]|nr:primase [Patescibacteria group bacterium]